MPLARQLIEDETPPTPAPEAAAAKPKPTFKEMQAIFAQRRAEVSRIVAELTGARSVRFKADGAGDIIVSPSTTESGQWQLTWFTKGTEEHPTMPGGHAVYPTFEEAARSAMGEFTKSNGPPHGRSAYRPVQVVKSKKEAREIVEAESTGLGRCCARVLQRGMNFHRTKQCSRAAIVRRGDKCYCGSHDPDRQHMSDTSARDARRRVLWLSKFGSKK